MEARRIQKISSFGTQKLETGRICSQKLETDRSCSQKLQPKNPLAAAIWQEVSFLRRILLKNERIINLEGGIRFAKENSFSGRGTDGDDDGDVVTAGRRADGSGQRRDYDGREC